LLLLALCATGCTKAQFNGVEYRDHEVAFEIGELPPGMRRLDSNEAKVTLEDPQLGTTIAIGARCGQDSDDVPLRALVQHLFLQFTDKRIISESEFRLDGRQALSTELTARLDGVLRHFVIVVLKKDGCVYDMIHVDGGGDQAGLEQSRSDFRKMVQGFHTIP
jgi:hypothetical protein